ncbi:MvaI/BcnI family restriction endonuclease [Sphingobacterium griseoflavum]|uniref:MvaI/BcnI restriction endonuclease domain-containing protein n=1 Tax=Sphingobacterium griseoflavum TaxID=1474952 RepID=A0ABQ3I2B5_9SPHI|nr:MvaI/BcnI family restriction endonuclease [Sphingobacterium griseoflavum]GHE49539.1 hypothetical protein GCM10017764_35680 [Sphingobacterium griseoflavum]
MRQLTVTEIDRLQLLTEKSAEVALIEPTSTGLRKSILDATLPLRSYLKEKNVHDYMQQEQGPTSKVQVQSVLIYPDATRASLASLYRPITKQGDPRIWFKGLASYADPHDVLAVLAFDQVLYVINITQLDLHALLAQPSHNPLQELLAAVNASSRMVADELLRALHKIAALGPIPALLQADTAVGRTLENLLGIGINSSKQPDYKGIELKSFRDKRGNRKTLFAQVPDWSNSRFHSSAEILDAFGYQRGEDFKLYCTVSTLLPNSQGLILRLDNKLQQLIEHATRGGVGDFVVWDLETLHKRLLEKHNETFWIAAESLLIDGQEHFIYKKVEHTRKPIVSQFDILLDQGVITLDHLIKRNAQGRVVEKGPLFKIKPKALNLLFPPSQIYTFV